VLPLALSDNLLITLTSVRKAILSIVATRRLTSFAHGLTTDAVNQLSRDVLAFKKESELVRHHALSLVVILTAL
jgi:hypothetical protein